MAIERKTWAEFRGHRLFWFVNRMLHLYGWTIVCEVDIFTEEVVDVYPARTEARGFSGEAERAGYLAMQAMVMDQEVERKAKEEAEDGS